MYDDLDLHYKCIKGNQNTDNIESNTAILTAYYNKLSKHFYELYDLVRDNYTFIIENEKAQDIDEKRFINIMGNILSATGNAKDVLEDIVNYPRT